MESKVQEISKYMAVIVLEGVLLSAGCYVGYKALRAMKLARTVVVDLWTLGARKVCWKAGSRKTWPRDMG